MILQILRALFVLLMAAVGWFFVKHDTRPFGDYTWLAMSISLSIAVLFVCVDILSPRKKLALFSGTILGLIVGVAVAYALSFVVQMLVDQYMGPLPEFGVVERSAEKFLLARNQRQAVILFVNLVNGMVCCYLAISFVLQTKDDFRFIIPYVEFSKQLRGPRPFLVDTSVVIDGRILDIAETGVIESRVIIPRFVLAELQTIADHGDRLKRGRGRRGLEMLAKLQASKKAEVILYEWIGHPNDGQGVDQKLLELAREINARLLTNDSNLMKVAILRGVDAVNLNDLAGALRPVVLPGERMSVRLVKAGEDPSQGVGFLDDGTMVVVKDARSRLNQEVEFAVTNVLQTSTGRMIFGRMEATPPGPASSSSPADAAPTPPTPPAARPAPATKTS